MLVRWLKLMLRQFLTASDKSRKSKTWLYVQSYLIISVAFSRPVKRSRHFKRTTSRKEASYKHNWFTTDVTVDDEGQWWLTNDRPGQSTNTATFGKKNLWTWTFCCWTSHKDEENSKTVGYNGRARPFSSVIVRWSWIWSRKSVAFENRFEKMRIERKFLKLISRKVQEQLKV